MDRKITATVFAIALMLFFLPWINSLDTSFGFNYDSSQTGIAMALLHWKMRVAIISILTGIGLSFVADKWATICKVVSGISGVLFIVWTQVEVNTSLKLLGDFSKHLKVNFTFWFYSTIFLLVAGAAISAYSLIQMKSNVAHGFIDTTRGNSRFCTECGSRNDSSQQYCSNCGTRLG
jgi:hypothetical protein